MAGRSMGSPHPNTFRRRLWLAIPLAAAGLLLLTGVASADLLTPESGGSKNADSIDTLYKLVFGLGIIIFLGVEGVLVYSLFKYRARKGAVAAQIHGNTQLEIGWTVGAAVILVFIAIFTFATLPSIRNPPNSDVDVQNTAGISGGVAVAQTERLPPNGRALRIVVNGQQYVWRYTYSDGDGNPLNDVFSYEEMVVPVGVTVTLTIRAQDVAHSWWIPKLGGKFDAVPGHTNYTWFKVPADKEGEVFRGQCAELCGRNHANMIATVRAVSPEDFEAWLEGKRREIDESNDAAAEQRAEIEGTQQEGPADPSSEQGAPDASPSTGEDSP
jgi:cytochrome c oxidase subunit 2